MTTDFTHFRSDRVGNDSQDSIFREKNDKSFVIKICFLSSHPSLSAEEQQQRFSIRDLCHRTIFIFKNFLNSKCHKKIRLF